MPQARGREAAPRCGRFPIPSPTPLLPLLSSLQGPGKKWENTPLTANGKPVFQKIHVKQGDTVQVVAGFDKGKVGVVQKVLPKTGKVVVEGVNVKTKSVQPKSRDEAGRLVSTESPVHASNVAAYSTEKKVRSRVGHKVVDGAKVRVLVKTGEVYGAAAPAAPAP